MNKIPILKPDCMFGIITVALCAFLLPFTFGLPPGRGPNLGSAFFPRVLLASLSILGILLIVRGLRSGTDLTGVKEAATAFFRPLALFGCLVIYVLVMPFLGYYLATAACLACGLYFLRAENWVVNVAMIAGFLAFVFLVFDLLLSVLLPKNVLFNF